MGMIKKQSLSLTCQYCSKEFGYLCLDNDDQRLELRRLLHDFITWAVCSNCAQTKGQIIDQPDDNMRYVRKRMHEL